MPVRKMKKAGGSGAMTGPAGLSAPGGISIAPAKGTPASSGISAIGSTGGAYIIRPAGEVSPGDKGALNAKDAFGNKASVVCGPVAATAGVVAALSWGALSWGALS